MASNKSQKLEDQAATAALYVTKGQQKKSKAPSNYPLDTDNKLSSASAASSLKHAEPRDLPAYPTIGIPNIQSSAGAAASLANANHREVELWQPDASDPASKAAMAAKDYKPAPLWHPELSSAGSKAALLAQKDGGRVDVWRPETTDAGNSAAGQAMRKKGLSPNVEFGVTQDGEKKALLAATGAIAGSRKRSGSSPIVSNQYPDSENAATNALGAATIASRQSKRAPQAPPPPTAPPIDAKKIHDAAVTNLSREMYTSHPPVAPEIEEKNKQAGLRAAAVSMAKQMYDIQQKATDHAAAGTRSDSHYAATSVHNRPASIASSEESHSGVPQYVNLQEAAQRLAAERLAKLNDEHAAYRTYYGATASKPQSKLSIRGRQRKRASSDGHERDSDDERSKQIRSEMSLFQDKLAQVDAKKRQSDREALMAAAQRNVKASIHGMDEKVFSETGKASPAMKEEWEAKAKLKAEAESKSRMTNHGRVNIGGGKYLDQSEVDAIAAAKVQPTIDQITEKAEQQRARDETIRAEREERERIAAEKVADQKLRDQMTKEEWKRFRDEEKREAKAKKEEEKAKKAEQKRIRQEGNRKSVEVGTFEGAESGVESEPPALDPIPKVDPISVDETAMEANTMVDNAAPEPTSGTDTKLEIPSTDKSTTSTKPVPAVEDSSGQPESLHAQIIAQRVVSAPVIDDPVDESRSIEPTATIPAAAEPSSELSTKPSEPLASRIAPSIPTASSGKSASEVPSTKTTVTAGASSAPTSKSIAKEKDGKSEGKVSSWLKTKFARRSSKPAKPDISEPTPTEIPSEKGFIGGANLTGASNTSVSRSGTADSEREVAMAGKPAAAPTAPVSGNIVNVADDDLYDVSPTGKPRRSLSSSSISSLSSDEDIDDVRGRNRLPREPTPMTHNLKGTLRGQPLQGAAAADGPEGVETVPAAAGTGRNLERESTEVEEEEFEEARDTFDGEALPPPRSLGEGAVGRNNDSPARDSKFHEAL
ncbi:MAG: hypothetical protein Q9195_001833 [Heterodermia aff. obscurata]